MLLVLAGNSTLLRILRNYMLLLKSPVVNLCVLNSVIMCTHRVSCYSFTCSGAVQASTLAVALLVALSVNAYHYFYGFLPPLSSSFHFSISLFFHPSPVPVFSLIFPPPFSFSPLFSHLFSAIDGAIKGETVEWESEWDQVRAGAAEVPQWWPFPEPYPQHHGGVCMGGWEHVYEYVWEGGGECVCMHECVLHSAVFYYS